MKKYIVPKTKVYNVNNENDILVGTGTTAPSSVTTNIVEEETNVQLSKGSSNFSDDE